jgi:hypothetical protein
LLFYSKTIGGFFFCDELTALLWFTVREQLSTTDSQANGRILDLKTGTVKKEGSQSAMRLCMGSRRGFICRLKVGTYFQGCGSGLDPDSVTLWIRIRIGNPDPGARKLSNFSGKNALFSYLKKTTF